jgi:hypothetical protein
MSRVVGLFDVAWRVDVVEFVEELSEAFWLGFRDSMG